MLSSIGRTGRAPRALHKQQGVVLLIALIILVAMTLASIGMMRSVDTGNVIAGNMAFRQATARANDAGTNAGFASFISISRSLNGLDRAMLNFDGNGTQPCPVGATPGICPAGTNINYPGYFSSPINPCEVTLTCANPAAYRWWTVDANWANAPSITVRTDPANNASQAIATVSYLIHRMCTTSNVLPTQGTCQWTPDRACNPLTFVCNDSVLYRITVRAVGARNTVTYAQTLVLNPQGALPP